MPWYAHTQLRDEQTTVEVVLDTTLQRITQHITAKTSSSTPLKY